MRLKKLCVTPHKTMLRSTGLPHTNRSPSPI